MPEEEQLVTTPSRTLTGAATHMITIDGIIFAHEPRGNAIKIVRTSADNLVLWTEIADNEGKIWKKLEAINELQDKLRFDSKRMRELLDGVIDKPMYSDEERNSKKVIDSTANYDDFLSLASGSTKPGPARQSSTMDTSETLTIRSGYDSNGGIQFERKPAGDAFSMTRSEKGLNVSTEVSDEKGAIWEELVAVNKLQGKISQRSLHHFLDRVIDKPNGSKEEQSSDKIIYNNEFSEIRPGDFLPPPKTPAPKPETSTQKAGR